MYDCVCTYSLYRVWNYTSKTIIPMRVMYVPLQPSNVLQISDFVLSIVWLNNNLGQNQFQCLSLLEIASFSFFKFSVLTRSFQFFNLGLFLKMLFHQTYKWKMSGLVDEDELFFALQENMVGRKLQFDAMYGNTKLWANSVTDYIF